MEQGSRFFAIISVIILGLVLQVFLGVLDCKQTPTKIAVAFTKAYYNLDMSMADYLCKELTEEGDFDIVGAYINRVADEARTSGFDLKYMRNRLYSIHTEIISESESEAEVRITATRKRNINPIYTVIGKLFLIGETYTVDETLNLIREDDKWKVCGKAFSLTV